MLVSLPRPPPPSYPSRLPYPSPSSPSLHPPCFHLNFSLVNARFVALSRLEKEVDAHAVAKRDLAYAHDEQLRLMQEVAALREVLDDRDAELRRAISSKDYLVQQVANLDGVGSAAKPLNQFE